MPVESAADLAGMFDVADFAVAGHVLPVGGTDVAVNVILDEADDFGQVQGLSVTRTERQAQILVAQYPENPGGAQLMIGARVFRILSARRDVDWRIWRLELRDAD